MKDQLKAIYPDLLNLISANFKCQEKPIYKEAPSDLESSQWRQLSVDTYAEFSHSTTSGNTHINHYNLVALMPSSLNFQQDFYNFFTRDFVNEMADTFRINDDNSLEYLIVLLQNFVCDGDVIPETLSSIKLAENPRQLRSESILQHYKRESDLYTHPTAIFNKRCENWSLALGQIEINGHTYILTEKADLELKTLLKQEYVEPILKLLIKAWILHQLVTHLNKERIEKHNFFKDQDIEQIIEALQGRIHTKISTLIGLSSNERQIMARQEGDINRFSLSPAIYQLMQRISFVKLFVGTATYDIHKNINANASFYQQFSFYLKTYLNFSLSKYLFDMVIKDFAKAKSTLTKFMREEKGLLALAKGFLKLLRSAYTMLWLPFLGVYFSLMGMSSIPFSLARKLFKIPFSSTFDKIITAVEAVKDLIIAAFWVPIACEWLGYIGAGVLGSVGMTIGGGFAFIALMSILSPFILCSLPEHYLETFPRWVSYDYGPYVYETQSSYRNTMDFIGSMSQNVLLRIHAFIGGVAFLGFLTIAFGGLLIHKVYKAYSPKLSAKTLIEQNQNLNHSPKFKELLKILTSKLESNSCNQQDNQILSTLAECQLAQDKKDLLKGYLNRKVEDETVQEKSVYRIALTQIDKESYLPSWKLILKLNNEINSQENPTLKEVVANVHQLYSTKLSKYV